MFMHYPTTLTLLEYVDKGLLITKVLMNALKLISLILKKVLSVYVFCAVLHFSRFC